MSQFPTSSDIKDSKFLRKEDVSDSGNVCVIAGFEQVNVAMEDQPAEMKWTMRLDGVNIAGAPLKPLVLNNTNWGICERAFGPDSKQWVGRRIKVFHDPNVSFGGKLVGGVRIRTPSTAPHPAPAAAPTRADMTGAATVDDFESDVPF